MKVGKKAYKNGFQEDVIPIPSSSTSWKFPWQTYHEEILSLESTKLLNLVKDSTLTIREGLRILCSTGNPTTLEESIIGNAYLVKPHFTVLTETFYSNRFPWIRKLGSAEIKSIYSRAYGICIVLTEHLEFCELEPEYIEKCLIFFQKEMQLRLVELRAIPVALSIVLIKRLADVVERLVKLRKNGNDSTRSSKSRLHLNEPSVVLRASSRFKSNIAEVCRNQNRGSELTKVQNIIAALRLNCWQEMLENVNLVHITLKTDPASIYEKMDNLTRERYCNVVEELGKRAGQSQNMTEVGIAEEAIKLCSASSASGRLKSKSDSDLGRSHVGYYLIGEGLQELKRAVAYKPSLLNVLSDIIRGRPCPFYLGSLVFLYAIFMYPIITHILSIEISPGVYQALAIMCYFPISELAASTLNRIITIFIRPVKLPKIDTSLGLPPDAKTMVVVPTMLTTTRGVQKLIGDLEIRFLGNHDELIYFALLADLVDADSESIEGDENLIQLAIAGINKLNQKYGKRDRSKFQPRFLFFCRKRLWNPQEGKWMGWERKRGKIQEFNRLLRRDKNTSFANVEVDSEILASIKYVITLDSDTRLPHQSARALVGTILHPLNQPQVHGQQIRSGYAIIQPCMGVTLESCTRSRFCRYFSGNVGGFDPYPGSATDIYQDFFNEGTFAGKGLYVVDAFQVALERVAPENMILNHDLFESSHARSALVSDIELLENYPTNYDSYVHRLHRWTRGDWQLVYWLFPFVPSDGGTWCANRLTLLSRFKIFDNLRRSLVAPVTVLLLITSWLSLPFPALFALVQIIAATFSAAALPFRSSLPSFKNIPFELAQTLVMVSFLPMQAVAQSDAIVRALYRSFISKRQLLEWSSLEDADASNFYLQNTSFVAILSAAILWLQPLNILIAAPFLFLWLLNPLLKVWLSGSDERKHRLSSDSVLTYRSYARRTWHFFETFIGRKGNWLIPDNFQVIGGRIDYRTSPTNIGLQLLSTVSALDFGYIGLLQFIEYVERAFTTLDKLERFRGHFYNWYDIIALEAISPKYVSTVDSGNLAGHLVTLKQACLELCEGQPVRRGEIMSGLQDTFLILLEEVEKRGLPESAKSLRAAWNNLESAENLPEWSACLNSFEIKLKNGISSNNGKSNSQARIWLSSLIQQVQQHQRDLAIFGHLESTELAEIQLSNSSLVGARLHVIIVQCTAFVNDMDFGFLLDEKNKLFCTGFNVQRNAQDRSHYDLLASEARLANFVAIAKGDVKIDTWPRLSRPIAPCSAIVSWSGSMFEYLMPVLVMHNFEQTLLNYTYKQIVKQQVNYGKKHSVPWGISEAGYVLSGGKTSYGPFGIPGLALDTSLKEETIVVSPYSSMLASMIDPVVALENLKRLADYGAISSFGFFESINFGCASASVRRTDGDILQVFYAHHQGMSLVALVNTLYSNRMCRRFHREPIILAAEVLLQERLS